MSWIQPNFSVQDPAPAQDAAQEQDAAVTTPVPTDDEESPQEYVTPEAAYPWWPVPDVEPAQPETAETPGQSYHASVRCANGELGKLGRK